MNPHVITISMIDKGDKVNVKYNKTIFKYNNFTVVDN